MRNTSAEKKRVSILVITESKETAALADSALREHAAFFDLTYAGTLEDVEKRLRGAETDLVLAAPLVPDGSSFGSLLDLIADPDRPFTVLTDDRKLASAASAKPGYLDVITPAELTAVALPRTMERLLREWRGIRKIRDIESALTASQDTHRRAKLLGRPVDWEWDIRNECLAYCSQEFATLHEMSIKETLQHFSSLSSDLNVIHPDDLEHWQKAKAEAVDGSLEVEYRIVVPSGIVKYVREISKIDFDENNEGYCMFGSVRDITETKLAEQALVASNKRFQRLYHETPSMFFTVGTSGKILSTNSYGARHLGYEPEELFDKPFNFLVHKSDVPLVSSNLRKTLAEPGQVNSWEVRLIREDGTVLWVRETARSVEHGSGEQQVLLVGEDITETRKLSEKLSYYASHDPPTKLLNRREFDQQLKRLIETAEPEISEHALCYLDLDQFKVVNDNCGHTAGFRVATATRNPAYKKRTQTRFAGQAGW